MLHPHQPTTALVPKASAPLARTDAYDLYVQHANAQPFLTADEEAACMRAWIQDQDRLAANKVILAHLRLVVKIARTYQRQWSQPLDLIQEGNAGLMEALYRFDPDKGIRFGSYASFWVKALILRFILDNWSLVKVGRSRAGRRLFFELQKERDALRARGIDPTASVLADRLGVETREVETIGAALDGGVLALDAPSGGDGATLAEILQQEGPSPEAQAARHELSELAGRYMKAFGAVLEGREKVIWERRMVALDPAPLSALGRDFGLSKQRVAQIENRLKARLRAILEEQLGASIDFS